MASIQVWGRRILCAFLHQRLAVFVGAPTAEAAEVVHRLEGPPDDAQPIGL